MKTENGKLRSQDVGGSLPLAPTAIAFSATPSARGAQRGSLFLLLLSFLLLITSCVSMQDDVYVDNVSNLAEISVFEKRFSVLDAQFFASEDSVKDEKYMDSCDSLLSDVKSALENLSLKKAAVARLYSIAGCVCFDMKDKSQAKKFYALSVDSFKGDERSFALARRLGIAPQISEKSFADLPLVKLEEALTHFANMEYSYALADFDEAFLSLEKFYRDSYSPLREKSWNLRNMNGSADAEILSLKTINVMQMVLLANRNPELLYNYTAGKNLSNKELYIKISGSGLLNPISKPLDAENAVSKDTIVSRIIAARFLWNLYNNRKNTPQLATKYSVAYANKKRSPIPDVKLDSPDFDAALGCVENEIMHLEDGIEFGSEKEVSGMEFDESIRRMK